MDFATILGIGSGVFLIFFSINQGGSLSAFLNANAFMIVIGGTFAATCINFPLKEVVGLFSAIKKAFSNKIASDEEIIERLIGFAETARRDGILAMEAQLATVNDPFFKKGLQLVIDGAREETVKQILNTEVMNIEDRHQVGVDVFIAMAGYSPAFGMIGTLIGLIQMLRSLQDPTQIGQGMAVALVTTFYGSILANLLFTPLAGKLKRRSKQEIKVKELILNGILGILHGDNPRMVRDTLFTFLKTNERYKLEK